MKTCPHCGKELPEEIGFCPYCMEKFTPETPVGGTPSHKHPLWWLAAIAALLLLIGLLVWLLWPATPPEPASGQPATPPATESGEEGSATGDKATTENTSGGTTAGVPSGGTAAPTAGHKATNPTTEKAASTTNTTASTTPTGKTEKTSGKTIEKSSGKTNSTPTSVPADPCADGHVWTDFVERVHHEEVGHYEEQATKSTRVTIYKCALCYQKHDSLEDYYTHFDTQHAGTDPNIHVFRDRYETDTEFRPIYEQVWVVDQEAYDEIVGIGHRCKRCGKIK